MVTAQESGGEFSTQSANTTKEKALNKLNKFTVKVAYPDQWKDYSKLTILSEKDGGTLYKNLQNITAWQYQKDLAKIFKAKAASMSVQTAKGTGAPMTTTLGAMESVYFAMHKWLPIGTIIKIKNLVKGQLQLNKNKSIKNCMEFEAI